MKYTMSGVLACGGALVGALALSGCATEDYVNKQIAPVQASVTALQGQVTTLEGQVNDHSAHLTKLDGQMTEIQGHAELGVPNSPRASSTTRWFQPITSTLFDVGKDDLSQEDKDRLLALAQKLKTENKNVYLEIQGHTDITGSKEMNQTLGRDRAIAVGRFLHDEGGVAINRMSIISYGETKPVAPTP